MQYKLNLLGFLLRQLLLTFLEDQFSNHDICSYLKPVHILRQLNNFKINPDIFV